MATTTKDTTENVQGQVLDSIRASQAAVIDGVQSWADTVQRFMLPNTSWPLADQLPTAGELIDSTFDYAAQVLSAQRDFAHSLLGATASITERTRQEADKATRSAKSA
jgi:hypothetical protein